VENLKDKPLARPKSRWNDIKMGLKRHMIGMIALHAAFI
jgi:hypothetical protein